MARTRQNKRVKQEGERRWHLPKLNWRRIATFGGGAAVVLALVFGLRYVLDEPIQRVEVRGHFQRVSQPDVEKIVRARLAGAGLLSIDLDSLGRSLKSLPWIDAVTVQRSWPRGLVVSVVEQNAVASWNNSGLLNSRGELFLSETRFERFMRAGAPLLAQRATDVSYIDMRYSSGFAVGWRVGSPHISNGVG